MTSFSLTLTTVLLLSSTATLFAQEPTEPPLSLPMGVRVRAISSTLGVTRGILLQNDGTSLQIASERGGIQKVPVASLMRFDLVVDQRRNKLKGALIGALAFGAMSFAWPVDPDFCGENTTNFCSRGEAVAGGVLVGAGIGALIGHFIKTDRFTPIDLNAIRPPPKQQAHMGRKALSFGVTFRF